MRISLTLLCFLFTLPALASDRKAKAFWNCAKGSCWVITETEKQVPETPVVQPGQKASDIAATGPALEPGMHSHQCPRCQTIWSHYPGGSHNCPSCGTTQFVQMSGSTQQRAEFVPQRRSIFRRGGG